MGVLGEMFPGRKLRSETGEAGSGQEWALGSIDFKNGVVELHRPAAEPADAARPAVDPDAEPRPDEDPPPRPRTARSSGR